MGTVLSSDVNEGAFQFRVIGQDKGTFKNMHYTIPYDNTIGSTIGIRCTAPRTENATFEDVDQGWGPCMQECLAQSTPWQRAMA